MKSLRLIVTLAFGLSVGAALMNAEDKPAPAKAPAKCCAKKADAGEKCTHECCAAAAKEGKNCAKCGGKN